MSTRYPNLDDDIVNFFEDFILEILKTHSFSSESLTTHIWSRYRCNVCSKSINYIVDHNYSNDAIDTLTCNEVIIKNILE